MKSKGLLFTLVSFTALLAACSSSSGNDVSPDGGGAGGSAGSGGAGGSAFLEPFSPPSSDVIIGQVVAKNGTPIEGVTVAIEGGKSGKSNYDGLYYIAQVPASDRIVLTFTHPGYITTTRSAQMFSGGKVIANAVMLGRVGSVVAQNGLASFAHGTVTLPQGAVVDEAGAPASAVHVQMTPIDIKGRGILSAPGDFSATNASQQTVQLETFGMAEFRLTDDSGKPLRIKDGQKATIELLLPEDTRLTEGQTMPAWSFDEATGRWVEEGQGIVQAYSQDGARLAFVADVAHFSSWNCDQEMQTTCIHGTVRLCDGSPAPGADLMGLGTDYDGTSNAYANGEASFCINARKNSHVRLYAASDYGGQRLVGTADVVTPDTVSSCPGPCVEQDIILPCSAQDSPLDCDDTYFAGCKSCVQGKVVDKDGNPVSAVVRVSSGLTGFSVVTDAQGHYCASAALDSMTSISATGPGNTTGQVSVVAKRAGKCPDCEAAPDLVLDTSSSSQEELDFSGCPQDVGGMTLQSYIPDGANPEFALLDKGWLSINPSQQTGEDGNPYWTASLHLISSQKKGTMGAPMISVQLKLQTPPSGPTEYKVEDQAEGVVFSADAYSSTGGVIGLGTETYGLGESGSSGLVGAGSIRFDNGFSAPGDVIKGSFNLELGPLCAPQSAKITLRGQIDTKAGKPLSLFPQGATDVNSPEYKQWLCSLYDLMVMSSLIQTRTGAVQASVDGLPVIVEDGADYMNRAVYSWEKDEFGLSLYGKEYSVMLSVSSPVSGTNPITSATLMESGSNCYYELKDGSLELGGYSGADSSDWLTGSFTLSMTKSQYSEGTCPDRTVTGMFGAPVCR